MILIVETWGVWGGYMGTLYYLYSFSVNLTVLKNKVKKILKDGVKST